MSEIGKFILFLLVFLFHLLDLISKNKNQSLAEEDTWQKQPWNTVEIQELKTENSA